MEIKVCVGSACYVKGSHDVIECFQKLIQQYQLGEDIELKAAFCLGNCTQAVSVMLNEKLYSVHVEEAEDFFRHYVIKRKS